MKLSMKGEGGVKKVQKSVYVVYGSPQSKLYILESNLTRFDVKKIKDLLDGF